MSSTDLSGSVSTADLYDERGEDLQSVSLQFQDLGGHESFSGPVRTIRCHEDNGLVKSVLNSPGQGAVLVVDGGGSLNTALMGDMIAAAAVENGWAGVIINGPIRDRTAISQLALGVKALGSNPRKSAKDSLGEVDVAVEIAGVTFRPGAMVYADADGILVER
jgi:regulator of ribonuclease activity A